MVWSAQAGLRSGLLMDASGVLALSSRPCRAHTKSRHAAHLGLRPRLLTAVPPGRVRAGDVVYGCDPATLRDEDDGALSERAAGGREFQRQDSGDSDGVMEDGGGAAGEGGQPGDLAVAELAHGSGARYGEYSFPARAR